MRGIAEETKRKAIFDFYRNRADVILLQETHSSPENEKIWEAQWGGRILFSHGTTAARGVCILFKKELFLNITQITRDMEGRLLICQLDSGSDSNQICVCNVYAPNQDSPSFFDMLEENLASYQ